MNKRTDYASSIRWMPCRNDSGQDIPANAVLRVTGWIRGEAGPVIIVAQPDATNAGGVAVNSPHPVPAPPNSLTPSYGLCTFDLPVEILFAAADGTPAGGDTWGTIAGDWQLHKAGTVTSFLSLGVVDGRSLFSNSQGVCDGSDLVVTNLCINPAAFVLPGDVIIGGSF